MRRVAATDPPETPELTVERAPAPARAAPGATDLDAADLYRARCAACHELERADLPHRRQLARLPVAAIEQKLAYGSMQTAARGLNDAQLAALAAWIANVSQ